MNESIDLRELALGLPEAERADLAYRLLLSLEPSQFGPDHADAWRDEIESRLRLVERGEATLSDWQESMERIRKSLEERTSR